MDGIFTYSSAGYLETLAEHGAPRLLTHSGDWIIERIIPGTPFRDAMGPYPLFSCPSWEALSKDLDELRETDLVSLLLVCNPIGPSEATLRGIGFDLLRPFKTHYFTDLHIPAEQALSKHHRDCARRARRKLDYQICDDPIDYLDEWSTLYDELARFHGIDDFRRFSHASFAKLLQLPGAILLRAMHDGRAVGGQIMLPEGNLIHAHLAAFSSEGYHLGASYFLDDLSVNYFASNFRYINWGGAHGLVETDGSGLAYYKKGWATDFRTSYIAGAILDRAVYQKLSGDAPGGAYFPAYRAGEFTQIGRRSKSPLAGRRGE